MSDDIRAEFEQLKAEVTESKSQAFELIAKVKKIVDEISNAGIDVKLSVDVENSIDFHGMSFYGGNLKLSDLFLDISGKIYPIMVVEQGTKISLFLAKDSLDAYESLHQFTRIYSGVEKIIGISILRRAAEIEVLKDIIGKNKEIDHKKDKTRFTDLKQKTTNKRVI